MPPGDDNVIKYNIQVDTTQVQDAIDQLQRAGQVASNGVGGISSNMLGSISNAYGATGGGYFPGMGISPGLMAGAMAPQLAAMYSANPMSAAGQMAYSALQMQYQAMGPNAGGITGAYGSPNFSLMGQPAAPYQLPIQNMLSYAPPGFGAPPPTSQFFGFGAGSALDMAAMGMSRGVFGRMANDNLEDPMFRMVERRSEAFAHNLANVSRFAMMDLGMGGVGAALGLMAGGPIGGFLGGIVGAGMGGMTNRVIDRLAAPIVAGAQDFRAYTAPFIRGDRPGGGMGMQETLEIQKELARRMTSDKWFTSKEYGELIKIAGETGVFQFTNNKQQALDAIDKLGESVKTLYSLGVKSREMLSTLSTAMNQYGIDTTNSQQMSNFFTGMAVNAKASGISTGEMVQAASASAQMGMAQGLGPAYGAGVYASSRAKAMGMMTSGAFGAFENALYGGAEGMANTLTQTHMQFLRTPVGETAMMSLMQNPELLGKAMQGAGLSVDQIVGGASQLAGMSPMQYMGLKARMPYFTQNLPAESMMNLVGGTLIEQFKNLRGGEKINPEEFIAFLQAMGMDQRGAMLLTDTMSKGRETGKRNLQSARDLANTQMVEGLRGQDLGRMFDKFVDGFREAPTRFKADMESWAYGHVERLEEEISGVRAYRLGPFAKEYADPMGLQLSYSRGMARSREMGIGGFSENLDSETYMNREKATQGLAARMAGGDSEAIERFRAEAKKKNYSDETINNYIKLGAGETVSLKMDGDTRAAARRALMEATGKSDEREALKALESDREKYRGQFDRNLRSAGLSSAYGDAYLNKADEVIVNKDTAGELAMKGVRGIMSDMSGVNAESDSFSQEGVRVQAGRASDYDQAGIQRMVNDRTQELINEGKTASEARDLAKKEVDTYLNRTQEDSDHSWFSFPGKGIDERDFGSSARSANKVALSKSARDSLSENARRNMVDPLRDFQKQNLDFIKGLGDKDRYLSEGFIDDLSTDSSFRSRVTKAFEVKGRDEQLEAVSKALFPGRNIDQLSADEKRTVGQFVAGASGKLDTDSANQNLRDLNGANINTGEEESLGLEEANRRRKEIIKELASTDSAYELLGTGNMEETVVRTNAALSANLVRLMRGSGSVREAAAQAGIDEEVINAYLRNNGVDPDAALSDQARELENKLRVQTQNDPNLKELVGNTTSQRFFSKGAMGAAGGLAGVVAGAKLGALVGGVAGSVVPVLGTATGAVLGGLAGAAIGAYGGYIYGDSIQDKLGMRTEVSKETLGANVKKLMDLQGADAAIAKQSHFMSSEEKDLLVAQMGFKIDSEEGKRIRAATDNIHRAGGLSEINTALRDLQSEDKSNFLDKTFVSRFHGLLQGASSKEGSAINREDFDSMLQLMGYDTKKGAGAQYLEDLVKSRDHGKAYTDLARNALAQQLGNGMGPSGMMSDRVGQGKGILDQKTIEEIGRTLAASKAAAIASEKVASNFAKGNFPEMIQKFTQTVGRVTDPFAGMKVKGKDGGEALRVVEVSPPDETKGVKTTASSGNGETKSAQPDKATNLKPGGT